MFTFVIKKVGFMEFKASKYKVVMLIDDNELDNFINQKVIESCKFADKIYTSTNGQSALEFLKNLILNMDLIDAIFPQVLFVDINMPLMDGFQFITEFEKLSDAVRKRCKVAVLTSSINPEDKVKAVGLKSDVVFLNKPLNTESLNLV